MIEGIPSSAEQRAGESAQKQQAVKVESLALRRGEYVVGSGTEGDWKGPENEGIWTQS